jgi:hypothetical protein
MGKAEPQLQQSREGNNNNFFDSIICDMQNLGMVSFTKQYEYWDGLLQAKSM